MRTLLIDTCTERGIIAYGNSQEILFEKELPFGLSQSKFLIPALTELFHSFALPLEVDFISVGIGPGSYTGIRIGACVAQTLAYVWRVPLVGVSSLEGYIPVLSAGAIQNESYAALLDARIGGVYCLRNSDEDPQVIPLENIARHLYDISHLITPHSTVLRPKIEQFAESQKWRWEERAPSAQVLVQKAEKNLISQKHTVMPPQHLQLLYLRQTQAETERNQLL